METEKKNSHGGARLGSGRKKTFKSPLQIRMSAEAIEALRALAKERNTTPGLLIEDAVLKHLL